MPAKKMLMFRPLVAPPEPGMNRMMDNLSTLYLDAGIVTPPPTPQLPNPASTPFAAYQTLGLTSPVKSR
jgi:hypothetical protein